MAHLVYRFKDLRRYWTTGECFPGSASYEVKARRSWNNGDSKSALLKPAKKITGLICSNAASYSENNLSSWGGHGFTKSD
jgi:hypothetical protein